MHCNKVGSSNSAGSCKKRRLGATPGDDIGAPTQSSADVGAPTIPPPPEEPPSTMPPAMRRAVTAWLSQELRARDRLTPLVNTKYSPENRRNYTSIAINFTIRETDGCASVVSSIWLDQSELFAMVGMPEWSETVIFRST